MSGWDLGPGERWGGRPVARTVDGAGARQRVVLAGTVVSVARRCPAGAPTLEAVLDDGTGRILLRWLGRDHVPGVRTGARLAARGTVLEERGRLVVLNPAYRFAPPSTSS